MLEAEGGWGKYPKQCTRAQRWKAIEGLLQRINIIQRGITYGVHGHCLRPTVIAVPMENNSFVGSDLKYWAKGVYCAQDFCYIRLYSRNSPEYRRQVLEYRWEGNLTLERKK